MKKVLSTLMILVLTSYVFSQNADSIKNWSLSGITSLNGSQVELSNWAAGGEKSLSYIGIVSLNANYKKGKHVWDNSFNLAYGQQMLGDDDAKKTDDKLEFSSKYGFNTKIDKWYYATLFSLKTQMTEGYKYNDDGTETKISDMFSPAYIVYSLGLDYKPSKKLSIYISPLTGKTTIVNSPMLKAQGVYGLEPEESSKTELGAYFKVLYIVDLMKNVNLKTNLSLFSSYTEKPENIDVNWTVLISMKVNKYISANISTELIYDDDIDIADDDGNLSPRIQFKEVFSIGFSYKF